MSHHTLSMDIRLYNIDFSSKKCRMKTNGLYDFFMVFMPVLSIPVTAKAYITNAANYLCTEGV